MDQARQSDDARIAGAEDERAEQRGPQPDPHPSIADAHRELSRVGPLVAADVAGGAEALAGFGIERDQRLVANVVDSVR